MVLNTLISADCAEAVVSWPLLNCTVAPSYGDVMVPTGKDGARSRSRLLWKAMEVLESISELGR